MIFRVLVSALLVLAFSLVSIAHAQIICAAKDRNADADYRKAIDLLDKEAASDEGEAIKLLKLSVERKCKGAALAMAEIYSIQAYALDKKGDRDKVGKLDDKIYDLLDKEKNLVTAGLNSLCSFLIKRASATRSKMQIDA